MVFGASFDSQEDLVDGTEFSVFLPFVISSETFSFSLDALLGGFLISLSPFFLSGDFLLRVPFTWHNEQLSL